MLLARRLGEAGILSPDTVAMNICPVVGMYRALEIFSEFSERCGATVLPLSDRAADAEIYAQAIQFGANTLMGMPSRLIALARTLKAQGWEWKVDRILFGGEFLQPGKRKLLVDTLGARHFSALYGSAELGIVAFSPELGELPVYRFPRDILQVEIHETDPEGYGSIIATNLVRHRFPVIRYRTGDRGRLVGEDEQSVTIELRGRESDSFQIGDDYHSIGDFSSVLSQFPEFQVQIHFDERAGRDTIRFCLVPEQSPLPESRRHWARHCIQEILQCDKPTFLTEVAFVGPGALLRSPATGKTPAIVDSRGR